jgi:hypothetical protein
MATTVRTERGTKISRPYAWIDKHTFESNGKTEWYKRGVVFTKKGVVSVYTQHDFARLVFVHCGREYYRTRNTGCSDRYLVTLADRFAADVAEGMWKD